MNTSLIVIGFLALFFILGKRKPKSLEDLSHRQLRNQVRKVEKDFMDKIK